MDQPNQYSNQKLQYWIRSITDFEDFFNKEVVTPEKIKFARHYVENKMGYDLNEDSLIDFSAIGIKLFGSMVVDIVLEYENYNGTRMGG